MTHGLLEILKYFFLAVLWLFFIYAARMVLVDARRSRANRHHERTDDESTEHRPPVRLRITEGEYRGETIELDGELTFGRSPACDVSLLQDNYASSVHARLFVRNGD